MTTPTRDERLLPCPFCNSPAEMNDDDSLRRGRCTKCECEGPPTATLFDAIAAWNRRAPAAAPEWRPGDRRCDSCDNGVQGGWAFCPYCGAQDIPDLPAPPLPHAQEDSDDAGK